MAITIEVIVAGELKPEAPEAPGFGWSETPGATPEAVLVLLRADVKLYRYCPNPTAFAI